MLDHKRLWHKNKLLYCSVVLRGKGSSVTFSHEPAYIPAQGFVVQWVEHSISNAEIIGSKPSQIISSISNLMLEQTLKRGSAGSNSSVQQYVLLNLPQSPSLVTSAFG